MLKIIRNTEEHENALFRIYTLMQSDIMPNTPKSNELELLALLVENYEKKAFPLPKPNPVEAIKFRMEQLGVTKEELLASF